MSGLKAVEGDISKSFCNAAAIFVVVSAIFINFFQ
jgi:hypothetical protein